METPAKLVSSKPMPYPVYQKISVVLTISGFINAAYLSVAHYRIHVDLGYASFCAITRAINCDTVSQSPFSIFGGVPVPVWGVLGYLLLGLILALQRFSFKPEPDSDRPFHSSLLVVALIFCLISGALGLIMATKVSSYCVLCILSYGINLWLFYTLWLMARRFCRLGVLKGLKGDWRYVLRHKMAAGIPLVAYAAIILVCLAAFPQYWDVSFARDASGLKTGITAEGLPWIGAEHPVLEITEFADYQCFQCKKMHSLLRSLVAQKPDRLRLLHRHYPMDHEFNFIVREPFHVGSGRLALLAIHAAAQGKFWETNDALYRLAGSSSEIDLQQLARDTGLEVQGLAAALRHPGYRKRLEVDIRHGLKLRILGAPSYLINGQVYEGSIPAAIMNSVLE
jgi:uncharacterized membrane protein/predicted DsbA family dithiol-disulfide isomerase